MVRRKDMVAASSGYIKTTPSETFLGRLGREICSNQLMGKDKNRNGSQSGDRWSQ